ncbi:heme-degrading domain-containing protein [Eubacterium barkeri]|uniref:Uncharacterized protein, UPF0303 family n=1 Tax=Eubacterium barkeri TaxID=1528 RepID=A0A1H3JKG6_EUBBA|nr:heme-binding protein [Eubacterium barkeri]SDY40387.1 Uncharacterized protein, UPF0303 family [Eubacterium barkeri]
MDVKSLEERIKELKEEQKTVCFHTFDEKVAWDIGVRLQKKAAIQHYPISIRIEACDRILFAASLPGAGPINDDWARRKGNTARRFNKSSYEMGLYTRLRGYDLCARYGLEPSEYAASGGAVPIIINGMTIGAITVSGLAENEDHDLVVSTIHEVFEE